eukprot:4968563-Pyramimonas_sp.AAC.1
MRFFPERPQPRAAAQAFRAWPLGVSKMAPAGPGQERPGPRGRNFKAPWGQWLRPRQGRVQGPVGRVSSGRGGASKVRWEAHGRFKWAASVERRWGPHKVHGFHR